MNQTASGVARKLALRSLLSCWLACLAVLAGSPAVGYSSHHALPHVTLQFQLPAAPVTGSPIPSFFSLSPSQSRDQPLKPLARPNLRFDCLSAVDGLSFSLARSILQDQQGFMWFGTRYGLNKYDGTNFAIAIPEPKDDPLYGNYVWRLYEDRTGDLWVITLTDLVQRDHTTGKFTHYKHDAANLQSLAPGKINTIAEDSTGTLWVGTNNGLNRYDRSTGTFTRFLQEQAVFEIYPDRQGGIWLGTASGLWYYEAGFPGQQQPLHYVHNPSNPSSLSNDDVYEIFEDQKGVLWVGTQYGGLNRLDRATGQFTRYQFNPDDPYSLSDGFIWSILEDDFGRLWIGANNGLSLFDPATDRFFRYRHTPGDPQSLSNDAVYDIYQDRSGVVWFATSGGICKLNETASRFAHYQRGPNQPGLATTAQPDKPPDLSDNLITSVYQDHHGILWIGTSSGGLNRLDRGTGDMMVYRHDPADPTSLSWGEVTAIYEDQAGTLWIGTSTGLSHLNPQTGTFEAEEAFRGQMVMSIAEDRQGGLWVGYWGGLLRREPGASDFAAVPTFGDLFATDRVQWVYPDRSGAVWISTQNNGLFRLDPGEDSGGSPSTVVHFLQDSGDPRSPGASPVMSVYEDSQGALWMGSIDDGLLRFDRDTQTFSHYTPSTGVAKYVGCIQGDAQGFLWMGTTLGLARFDPRSEEFSYLDARDGLEIGEGLTCFQSEQGEMLFGGMQGLSAFFPDQIRDNPNPPPVVITALNLNNQPLRTDLLADEQVKLSYRENNLSFDFAALDYTAPAKNQYAYKMEGLETDWVDAGARRHADYPDLKPGTYTFRVKASNNSGVWNEQGAVVHITITPPFWQTWWFLVLLGVGFLGVIAGGVRLRLEGMEARSRELERQVADRTAELSRTNFALEQEIAERLQVEEALRQSERERAVVDERNRLARELHDSVAQSMYGVTLLAEVSSQLLSSGRVDQVAGYLGELKETAKDSLAEMRLLIYELRPPVLEEQGLASALQARLEAVESRAGLETEFHLDGEPILDAQVEEALFRIAQEALNNTLKHAHARRIAVALGQTGQTVVLEVADDGAGFDPAAARRSGGLGLRGMEERAAEIGARLEIESAAGSGTRVRVVWEGDTG